MTERTEAGRPKTLDNTCGNCGAPIVRYEMHEPPKPGYWLQRFDPDTLLRERVEGLTDDAIMQASDAMWHAVIDLDFVAMRAALLRLLSRKETV